MLAIPALVPLYAIPERPVPERLVNDYAGIFTTSQEYSLERMLTAFDDSTSNQIAIVTISDLEGYSSSEYATRIGLDWGIGTARHNNGIVVLIKPKTAGSYGDVAISVGYGLEGAIPDAYCRRIIDSEMIPYFSAGDYYSGTVAGCEVLMQLATGEISEPREKEEGFSLFGLMAVFIVFCLIFFAILGAGGNGGDNGKGGSGSMDGDDIMKGIIIGSLLGGHRRRGGGFGSGGGFDGGFGGFGGFGGGDFGGGGASGRW